MKTKTMGALLLVLTFLLASNCFAESINAPFSAVCEDVVTHGYRSHTDLSGNPIPDSWTTDEHFYSKWKFIYAGGKNILIDGKPGVILLQLPQMIIAAKLAIGPRALSAWVYAINLRLKKIVGAEANAYTGDPGGGDGVKARAVEFKCRFDLHSPQSE
jgi:hypothetical protein